MKVAWLTMALGLILSLAAAAQTKSTTQVFETAAGTVKITPIAHAAVRIDAAGKILYLDPAPPAKVTGLPPGDLILITDIHPDHLNADNLKALSKTTTEIWGPPAVAKAYPRAKAIGIGTSAEWNGWKIETLNAYNLVRGPEPGKLYHDKGRGVGYVLTYGGKRFYFSGDTEVTSEMRALKNIDVAFVCMNLPFTMTPQEAAEGIKAFHPKVVIPYHYRGSDLTVLEKALAGTGIEVRLLDLYPQ
jgi:L-ascorbate metabolism protein UlaG (beta-lactamase superfamily)